MAPDPARFPSLLRVFSYVPSPDGLNENLLILLHGLGDTHKNYESLGRTMAVPQTCCLALRAPLDLPFELGYGWFPAFNQDDGSLITPTVQEKRRLNGLAKAQQLLTDFLAVLEREYDWEPSRVFLLGFSQGAVVAVRLALTLVDRPLGGVIAVSSSLLEEEALATPIGPTASAAPPRTPLLVTHGRRDRMVPLDQARRHLVHVRSRYGAAEAEAGGKALVQWKEYEKGHEMIKSREEMQDVMAFLAEHLRLRSVALERRDDLIEVTPGHSRGQ